MKGKALRKSLKTSVVCPKRDKVNEKRK